MDLSFLSSVKTLTSCHYCGLIIILILKGTVHSWLEYEYDEVRLGIFIFFFFGKNCSFNLTFVLCSVQTWSDHWPPHLTVFAKVWIFWKSRLDRELSLLWTSLVLSSSLLQHMLFICSVSFIT